LQKLRHRQHLDPAILPKVKQMVIPRDGIGICSHRAVNYMVIFRIGRHRVEMLIHLRHSAAGMHDSAGGVQLSLGRFEFKLEHPQRFVDDGLGNAMSTFPSTPI
jgi:hypothetical protein